MDQHTAAFRRFLDKLTAPCADPDFDPDDARIGALERQLRTMQRNQKRRRPRLDARKSSGA